MVVVEKLANDLYSAFQAMSNVFGEHLSNMALLEIATRLRQNGPESNVISALLLMLKRCPTYL
jgi:hypothetical protein